MRGRVGRRDRSQQTNRAHSPGCCRGRHSRPWRRARPLCRRRGHRPTAAAAQAAAAAAVGGAAWGLVVVASATSLPAHPPAPSSACHAAPTAPTCVHVRAPAVACRWAADNHHRHRSTASPADRTARRHPPPPPQRLHHHRPSRVRTARQRPLRRGGETGPCVE
eukprot:scaffold637_cov322-Prasinococcus_capsulatus_cf.AAC.2